MDFNLLSVQSSKSMHVHIELPKKDVIYGVGGPVRLKGWLRLPDASDYSLVLGDKEFPLFRREDVEQFYKNKKQDLSGDQCLGFDFEIFPELATGRKNQSLVIPCSIGDKEVLKISSHLVEISDIKKRLRIKDSHGFSLENIEFSDDLSIKCFGGSSKRGELNARDYSQLVQSQVFVQICSKSSGDYVNLFGGEEDSSIFKNFFGREKTYLIDEPGFCLFYSAQVACHSSASLTLRVCALVKLIYKSIELSCESAKKKALLLYKDFYHQLSALGFGKNVRDDPYHLKMSILTAMLHLAIDLEDVALFDDIEAAFLQFFKDGFRFEANIYPMSVFNIVKCCCVFAVFNFMRGNNDKFSLYLQMAVDEAGIFFSRLKNNPSGRIALREFKLTQDIILGTMLLSSFDQFGNPEGWFKKNMNIGNFDDFLRDLVVRLVRVKSETFVDQFFSFSRNLPKKVTRSDV